MCKHVGKIAGDQPDFSDRGSNLHSIYRKRALAEVLFLCGKIAKFHSEYKFEREKYIIFEFGKSRLIKGVRE